ncbi:MAG: hypothetical protein HY258_00635 [Chloroflexi bacterium]|nr:hypothetical protein [Chloroflexota bacterium]
MPKKFYTEKDIEDLFKSGVRSLSITDNAALTELAYEKANRIGMQLVQEQPDNPPSAPVRPYLSQAQKSSVPPAKPTPTVTAPPQQPESDLHARIRNAVTARLGNQVDPALLDTIIERVLKSTGLK